MCGEVATIAAALGVVHPQRMADIIWKRGNEFSQKHRVACRFGDPHAAMWARQESSVAKQHGSAEHHGRHVHIHNALEKWRLDQLNHLSELRRQIIFTRSSQF